MAALKCPECGKDISESVNECPHCGYPLSMDSDFIQIKNNKKTIRNKKIIAATVATVLIVVGSIQICYFLKKRDIIRTVEKYDNIMTEQMAVIDSYEDMHLMEYVHRQTYPIAYEGVKVASGKVREAFDAVKEVYKNNKRFQKQIDEYFVNKHNDYSMDSYLTWTVGRYWVMSPEDLLEGLSIEEYLEKKNKK